MFGTNTPNVAKTGCSTVWKKCWLMITKCPECGHKRKPRKKAKPSTLRVLWIDDNALYVREYSNKEGRIHGRVINGEWKLYVNTLTKTMYCKSGLGTVTKRPYKKLEQVVISKTTCKKLAKWHNYDEMPHMGARLIVINAYGCYDGSGTYAHYNDVITWAEEVRKMRKELHAV
jgi:hypothetical protein